MAGDSDVKKAGTVLLIGGTGKVGRRIAPHLRAAGVPHLVASRSGRDLDGSSGVRFDWFDKTTFVNPFDKAGSASPVRAVYFIVPPMPDPLSTVAEFVDLARSRGAKRFVVLSSTAFEYGGPIHGQIHKYLKDLGDAGEIEWCALRPTWFIETILEVGLRQTIKETGKMYSATGAGKVPWVAAQDIAACAFHALTNPESPNTDWVILGPELLSYDDLAKILTDVTGTKVEHADLAVPDMEKRFIDYVGLPEEYAKVLTFMDLQIKDGSEDRLNDVVRTVAGKDPITFRELAVKDKAIWWDSA